MFAFFKIGIQTTMMGGHKYSRLVALSAFMEKSFAKGFILFLSSRMQEASTKAYCSRLTRILTEIKKSEHDLFIGKAEDFKILKSSLDEYNLAYLDRSYRLAW